MKRLIILILFSLSSLYGSIGEISAVSGEAFILRDGKKITISVGEKINKLDTIQTQKTSKVQIIFKDNTIISLGQKTTFSIKEYLYKSRSPRAKFQIKKGLFKSITGKIGHIAPKNFILKTQNATIGVRGTTVIAQTSKEFDNIVCSSGQIVVHSNQGIISLKKGEQTMIRRDLDPIKATKIPQYKLNDLEKNLQISQTVKSVNKKDEIKRDKLIKVLDPITQTKEEWGDWDKEDIIKKDFQKEQDSFDDKKRTNLNPKLSRLREIAGEKNPLYRGKVSGFINTRANQILQKNNHINLNVNLGDGSIKGDIGFEGRNHEKFQSDLKGRVDERGVFKFELQKGSGDGVLSGKTLDRANGSFSMQNEKNHKAFGTFNAKKVQQ